MEACHTTLTMGKTGKPKVHIKGLRKPESRAKVMQGNSPKRSECLWKKNHKNYNGNLGWRSKAYPTQLWFFLYKVFKCQNACHVEKVEDNAFGFKETDKRMHWIEPDNSSSFFSYYSHLLYVHIQMLATCLLWFSDYITQHGLPIALCFSSSMRSRNCNNVHSK